MWTAEQLTTLADTQPRTLVPIILDMQARLQALESRGALHSQNSSQPPSSDGYLKPAPKSLRDKSGRKPGGQNGHPGYTLRPTPSPDDVVTHPLTSCPCGCGKDLRRLPLVRYERRQVFDLPEIRLAVTEHRAEVKVCPCCAREQVAPFPQGVNAPAQYGPRLKSWLSYWRHQQLLPLDRLAQMCHDLLGHPVSEATIQGVEVELDAALAPFAARLRDLLRQAPLAHFDETGVRVAGRLHWLHGASTDALTWYGVHAKRGSKAMDEFGILPRFHGRAVHDCLESYFRYRCDHGTCNAHLLRELVFMDEVLHEPWARPLRRLLLRMLKAVRARGPEPLSRRRIEAFTRRYRALVAKGLRRHPRQDPIPRRRGRPRQSKAHNLLRRLHHHEISVLAFLHDPSVPFTNNLIERDLRMSKVQQKISGTFRTLAGARRFARIRAYISTARKNRCNILDVLSAALQHQPFMPRTPA